jgi:hypothetical protein
VKFPQPTSNELQLSGYDDLTQLGEIRTDLVYIPYQNSAGTVKWMRLVPVPGDEGAFAAVMLYGVLHTCKLRRYGTLAFIISRSIST